MTINKTKSKGVTKDKAHTNYMGAPAFDISSPLTRLRVMAASCFFGEPSYYLESKENPRNRINSGITDSAMTYLVDVLKGVVSPKEVQGKTPAEALENAIDQALAVDVEGTLAIAAELRNEDNIRTTPQVIMVRAANHPKAKGTGLIRKYAPRIIRRTDESSVQMAYQINKYGKTIPNSLKKAWKTALEACDDYKLAKYRMENRVVKTIDVVRVSHAHSDPIDKLVHDKLKLNQGQTWESIISAQGASKDSWTQATEVMGHMALLRNLRNFSQHGVDTDLYLPKLVESTEKGNQLPFRYYTAYDQLKQSGAPLKVQAAVEDCMNRSIANLPKFEGRVMSLCDNSGSAHGTLTSKYGSVRVSTIANLTGVITGMIADEGHVGVFGDKLATTTIDSNGSVLQQTDKVEKLTKGIGQGTETGIWLFWDNAIKQKEHWDHVFVYSDMQAGHGGLFTNQTNSPPSKFSWNGGRTGGYGRGSYVDVPALIAEYRKQVNPNVQVYLVQVAGYDNTIIPECYDKTYIMGGWSDGIFRFAHKMSKLNP